MDIYCSAICFLIVGGKVFYICSNSLLLNPFHKARSQPRREARIF